jgi:hypothetical protein
MRTHIPGLLISLLVTAEALTAAKVNPTPPRPKEPERPVSFRLDVMPVFFRAGCNSGGCHGAARGKDGFHLGLFGYDPAGDYFRLTQQIVGRRIDLAAPEQSLLLLKATGMVPHSGGRRFKPDSEYYKTLLRWIQAGAPDDAATVPQVTGISLQPDKFVFSGKVTRQPLQVIAKYSDGTTRDVTRLALYLTNNKNTADIDEQGVVTAAKRGDAFVFARFAKYTVGAVMIVLPKDKHFRWPKVPANNYIDELVDAKLQKLRIVPSALSTDEEFLRRVYLDLIGMLPTMAEHNRFVASKDRDKRNKLVNELLERPEYVDLWTTKWAEALKIVENNNTSAFGSDRKAAFAYYQWIHDQVKKNTPLDQFVRKQVASTGSNLEDPAVNLYTMLPQGNYDPKAVALDVAQLFTGIRIQCSECHNHPFDRWTQDDFYGFVSFFTGVRRKGSSEARELFIYDDPNAPPAKHLLTGQPVPAKFLGEDGPGVKGKDPRVALADWLTSSHNTMFTQNMANRIWANFFARAIVEPVDDVRISNPPSNRELLEELGRRLASYGFDQKRLIRDICASRTYQLSAATNANNRDDDQHYSHTLLRRLRADALLDAISQATGTTTSFRDYPAGYRAMQLFEGNHRANNYFLKTFGESARETVNCAETRLEPTLAQSLHLVNGDTIETKLAKSTVIADLLKSKRPPAEMIDEMYIRALSRKPSEAEKKRMLALVAAKPTDRQPYEDVFWALLNSTEFAFNH